jgi:hypothetical protein
VLSGAVGFAGLAIVLVVLSLSFQLALALRSGAILVTLVWLYLEILRWLAKLRGRD